MVGGIIQNLSDLKQVVQNQYVENSDEGDDDRPGHFISTMDKVGC